MALPQSHTNIGLREPDASTFVSIRTRFVRSSALASKGRLVGIALAAAAMKKLLFIFQGDHARVHCLASNSVQT